MDAARSLSFLALRPLLDAAAEAGPNPLADLDPETARRLSRALGRTCADTWKALEVVWAGPTFWDGCAVFLSPEECLALHEQVGRLRAEVLVAEEAPAEEQRRACLAEWHAARKAGRLPGSAPDLAGFAEAIKALGRPECPDRLSAGEQNVAQQLADELRTAGFPSLARLATPAADGSVPLLVAAVRFFLGRQLEAEPGLALRLGWPGPVEAGEREQALGALAQTLTTHGRGLQEWLDEEAAAPTPASRPIHARAASRPEQAASPTDAPAAAEEDWQESAEEEEGGAADGSAAAPPAAPPLTGRQRFWGVALPLLALLVPVVLVLWLVYRHALGEVRQFVGHEAVVTSLAFSPDGKQLLSGSGDRTVRLWDVDTGAELQCFKGHAGEVHAVAFAPDGKTAVSGGLDTVRLWDLKTGKAGRRLDTPTNFILSVAFSPDGRHILSTSKADRLVRIWDVQTGKEVGQLKGHTADVESAVYSPDGKLIASGAGDDTVRIWDAATGKELQRCMGHQSAVTSVAFTPDGKHVLSGSLDKTARVWSVQTGKELVVFRGHTSPVVAVAISPDSRYVATGSLGPGVRKREEGASVLSELQPLRVWDTYTGGEAAYFESDADPTEIWSVAFSPDGRYLASAGFDKIIRLWNAP